MILSSRSTHICMLALKCEKKTIFSFCVTFEAKIKTDESVIVMKFVQTGENLTDMTVIVKQEEFGTVMENAESKKIPVKIRSNSCRR